jgi:hypothetical protein
MVVQLWLGFGWGLFYGMIECAFFFVSWALSLTRSAARSRPCSSSCTTSRQIKSGSSLSR